MPREMVVVGSPASMLGGWASAMCKSNMESFLFDQAD